MNLLRHRSPHQLALLLFLAYLLIVITDLRHFSRHDPESVFFDPDDAFVHRYTALRQAEAAQYISTAERAGDGDGYVKARAGHSVCVGVATVQRDGVRYFKDAVGSVLAGLTREEREDMALINFIVDLDPAAHQAYNESWLPLVSDRVLTYRDADEGTRNRAAELYAMPERFKLKPLFDYVYLLQACYDDGAEWIVMLEDDTLAAEGWYMRTKEATAELARSGKIDEMVYLRLFANEGLLGWNSEEWPTYLLTSLGLTTLVLTTLLTIRRLLPLSAPLLTTRTILTTTFALLPLTILLFFLTGRLTLAGPHTGLNRMDNYGCCSQAFVFHRTRLPALIDYYTATSYGFVDQLTEIYANERGLARWALMPPPFQHVGSTSSKATGPSKFGRNNAENIWNYHFEFFDPEALKGQHWGV